eukprot:14416310-Alexandrium_andersonii.AAC.1
MSRVRLGLKALSRPLPGPASAFLFWPVALYRSPAGLLEPAVPRGRAMADPSAAAQSPGATFAAQQADLTEIVES